MRDLAFLRENLASAEKPGLDAHDPRFLAVSDLGQKGDYAGAADALAGIFAEHIYDIRLLGFYLFQAFREDGPARIGEILETVQVLVEKNLAALGPAEKRELHLNKSLMWLFQTMLDALEYHRQKNDEQWVRWMQASSEAVFVAAAERTQALDRALAADVYQKTGELLARVGRWMRDLRDSFAAAAVAAAAAPAPPPKTAVPAAGNSAAAGGGGGGEAANLNLPGQVFELRGSPEFVQLCNKLKAFELLVERKDFAKAAMVGDDILAIVGAFDPRKYFPDLFASFGALLHAHVVQIKPFWENKDSVDWQMAEQFYRVDLETFVRGK